MDFVLSQVILISLIIFKDKSSNIYRIKEVIKTLLKFVILNFIIYSFLQT